MNDESAYNRIESIMCSHPSGLTVRELQDMLLDLERNAIDVSLKRLQEHGVIYRVGRGFYRPYEDQTR
jgi:predicted transcriptional regulator of viral defense system